jgi:hypothetical protein
MPDTVRPAEAEARTAHAPADPALERAAMASSSAPRGRLPTQSWFSDLPDRGLFIIVLTLGTGAVLALKLGPLPPDAAKWWATGVAAAVLLGYAALAWLLRDSRLPADRLGDNCYYLGFLLTLASMAAALIQFDLREGDRGEVIGQLIGSFGIALMSTFLGIALRVLFLQMRREVDDLEETLRHDLQQHADLLKGQLLFAVTELESFRLRTRQVMDERLIQVTDLFAVQSKAQLQQVIQSAQQVADEGSRVLGEHTRQAMALEEAIRAQTQAAADLAERLARIEIPPDLFRQEIRALTDRIGTAAAPLEQAAGAFATRVERIEVPTDWVAARLAPFIEALDRATAAVERMGQAEVARRTALDDAAARATTAIEQATRELLERPRGIFGRLAYALGWQRTRR